MHKEKDAYMRVTGVQMLKEAGVKLRATTQGRMVVVLVLVSLPLASISVLGRVFFASRSV